MAVLQSAVAHWWLNCKCSHLHTCNSDIKDTKYIIAKFWEYAKYFPDAVRHIYTA